MCGLPNWSPWYGYVGKKGTAMFLNFLFWGLGYLLYRKRVVFGALLTLGRAISIIVNVFSPIPSLTSAEGAASVILTVVFGCAFAYDVYQLANEPPVGAQPPRSD